MHRKHAVRGWSRLAAGLVSVVIGSGLALASPAATASSAKPATPAGSKDAPAAAAKLDINSASQAELAALPGIGDVYSKKIVDGRPYKSKAELESKHILPKGVYDKIAPLVIAHQK